MRHRCTAGRRRGRRVAVFGVNGAYSPEWAAWANGVAVRELDFHDTFLAAEYSHPGDNIPPLVAVSQHKGVSGRDLIRGLATAYGVQIDLVRGISLHKHKIDHVALGPSAAAGIGTMLGLDVDTIYQAVGQAFSLDDGHPPIAQGPISSWKAYAPALAGKVAIGRSTGPCAARAHRRRSGRARTASSLGCSTVPDAEYTVGLPAPGEAKRAILDSYTKEHSAEYQSQAPIDLARRMRERVGSTDDVESIVLHTSNHTHVVIGTGSGDPQKFDPTASRETLDHSVMYIRRRPAGRDVGPRGPMHRARARPDTVELWRKISTVEDPEWTRRYHSEDPDEKAFGARAVITMKDGTVITDELAVADAHPLGARPFARKRYEEKFTTLADGVVDPAEQQQFLDAASSLADIAAGGCSAPTSSSSGRCWPPHPRSARDLLMDLFSSAVTDTDKRKALRAGLDSGVLQRWPGSFSHQPKLIEDIGFEGVYVSVPCSADLGLPDIGLTTLTEVAARGGQIARATNLPSLIDADTGFGEPMSAARTVAALEDAGLSGCHLETRSTRSGAATSTVRPWSRLSKWSSASGGGQRPPRRELRHLRPHRRACD